MEIDYNLLKKYFTGNATPEEQDIVAQYLEGNDHTLLDSFREAVKAASLTMDKTSAPFIKHQKRHRIKKYWAAASIILLAGISALIYVHTAHPVKGTAGNKIPVKAAPHLNWITNDEGEIKNIRMPDGTAIWMDRGAKIAYADDFNETKRDLILRGKAYFDVAKNAAKPFRVFVDSISVTALGTAFTINHKEALNSVKVSLIEGKVAVATETRNHKDNRMLLPGYSVEFNNNQLGEIAADNLNRVNDWLYNKLYFDDESLATVLATLAFQYQTKIAYDLHDIKGIRFSGNLNASDGLRNMLDAIAHANGLKVAKLKGDTYRVSK